MSDKYVVITGGLGRLGRALVKRMLGNHQEDRLLPVVLDNKWPTSPNESSIAVDKDITCMGYRVDVTNEHSLRHIARLNHLWGNVVGIVNLAAIDYPPTLNHSGEVSQSSQMRQGFEVGVVGMHLTIGCFSVHMLPGASIVNMGSVYGGHAPRQHVYPKGFRKPATYCAVKAAVEGLTRWWAGELADRMVRVNCVRLGGVADLSHTQEFKDAYSARVMLGRMAHAREAVDAILWLLSPQSSYITGAVIPVDGGYGAW